MENMKAGAFYLEYNFNTTFWNYCKEWMLEKCFEKGANFGLVPSASFDVKTTTPLSWRLFYKKLYNILFNFFFWNSSSIFFLYYWDTHIGLDLPRHVCLWQSTMIHFFNSENQTSIYIIYVIYSLFNHNILDIIRSNLRYIDF